MVEYADFVADTLAPGILDEMMQRHRDQLQDVHYIRCVASPLTDPYDDSWIMACLANNPPCALPPTPAWNRVRGSGSGHGRTD